MLTAKRIQVCHQEQNRNLPPQRRLQMWQKPAWSIYQYFRQNPVFSASVVLSAPSTELGITQELKTIYWVKTKRGGFRRRKRNVKGALSEAQASPKGNRHFWPTDAAAAMLERTGNSTDVSLTKWYESWFGKLIFKNLSEKKYFKKTNKN